MYQVYKVLPNETIEDIAKKIGSTVEELYRLNGELSNSSFENGYIIIPVSKKSLYETYIIQKGDTIYSIAKNYSVSPEILLSLNGLDKNDYIYPGEQLLIPKENIYITKEESINDIHNKTGLSLEEIVLNNKDLIVFPNQIIRY